MSNLITKTTELAMALTLTYVRSGDTVVDATCGTGQDTAALAKAVGPDGHVYAFDIQKKALLLTEARLKSHGYNNVKLMMKSFESMSSHLPEGSAAAVVFNLGYLPGGDHSVTTTAETTIRGLEAALRTVKTGGIVTVVLYDGHDAGKEEKKSVMDWAESLDSKRYHAVYVNMLNQKKPLSENLWITKK